MEVLVLNLLGIALIVLTLWWFFWAKPRRVVDERFSPIIEIRVKGGIYEPSFIQVPAKTALTLHFYREDPTPCAEVVVFPSLRVSYYLPLNKKAEIKLEPQPAGILEFVCQMGMYRGQLLVE